MKTCLLVQIGVALAVGVSSLHAQSTPSTQSLCDMPGQRGTAIYNKYCGGGTAAPAAPASLNPALGNAAQSIGNALGQQLGKSLFGRGKTVATPPIQPMIDPAQQQREFAAQQLNNSGLYFLKQKTSAGAIAAKNEFQKALDQTPNDANILRNLALAKQQLKDITAAGQTSSALSRVLPPDLPVNKGIIGDELTHDSIPSPNDSALSLVNLDPNVVDLRSATSASPKSLKSQLDEVFGKAPASTPSAKLVNPIDGPQENKAEMDAVFAKPKPDPNATMKKWFDLYDKSE